MGLTQADFDYLRTLVRERSAMELEPEKAYLAETRLAALVRRERLASPADLIARLRRGPAHGLHEQVVEAMTNNETSFFRDLHPFETMRQQVLPELVRRRADQRGLHIWCGACSSGQEPYSVAMLLREHFPALANWQVRLVASDLSAEMLGRAREGCYSQLEVNRGLPARLLVKYFRQDGPDWRIRDDLRRQVEFSRINLMGPWPPLPPMDIILLRNVLIYFGVEAKKQILAKVRRLLRPDGYLFLGGAETTLNLDEAFERLQFDRSGCYRLAKGSAPP